MERQNESRREKGEGEMEGQREGTIPRMSNQGEDHWTSGSCL